MVRRLETSADLLPGLIPTESMARRVAHNMVFSAAVAVRAVHAPASEILDAKVSDVGGGNCCRVIHHVKEYRL